MNDKSTPETQAKAHAGFLKKLGTRTLVEYENDLEAERDAVNSKRNAEPDYLKLWNNRKADS